VREKLLYHCLVSYN